jgi:hypothetical protein
MVYKLMLEPIKQHYFCKCISEAQQIEQAMVCGGALALAESIS